MGSPTRAPARSYWHPDGTGVEESDRTAGIARGTAFSVRFIRDDKPGSQITLAFYPAGYGDAPARFLVQWEARYVVCGNPAGPGGTEIWSAAEHGDLAEPVFTTASGAEMEARLVARQYLAAARDARFDWDGEPVWPEVP